MESLKKLYQNHFGKVTQKWSIYFDQYENKLSQYKKFPIKLFEIGIENGGSLEIFSKYFSNAELILGCDIDPNCEKLQYDKSNIKVIIGDAKKEGIKNEIIKHSKFDIIIDDGSHNSDDIVRSFCNYFNHLKDDGLYIIEDLHCSYHQQHRGGIFYPISSINFFKKLVDIINYEHWGIEKKKDWLLRGFSENYKIIIKDITLDSIHSIEFVNSLCFIKKKSSKDNKIGKRIVVGESEIVAPDRKKYDNTDAIFHNQSNNPWSNNNLLPEEELVLLQKKLKSGKQNI